MTNLAKSFNSASSFLSIYVERRIYAVGFRVRHNVSGIAEVGAFENRQLKYSTKADRSTNVDILPSAPILAIPC